MAERLAGPGAHLVGIGGAVAVGKTTVALELASHLRTRGRKVDVVSTDAFLHPNRVLLDRGIAHRKGFPESFDRDAMAVFARDVKAGGTRIELPVYSHAIYDILPGETVVVEAPDVVVVEGVIALQPPLVEALDAAIYVEAEEELVRGWFVERFLGLVESVRTDPASFYARFAGMQPDEVRALAEGTWDTINGPNLREHVRPSRARATFVLEKGVDHSVRSVVPGSG